MRVNANIREITKLDPSHDKVIPYIVLTRKIYAKICTWKLWCTKYMNTTYQNVVSHVTLGLRKSKLHNSEKKCNFCLFSIIYKGQFKQSYVASL